ncbi:RNA polymerase sigma factor sigW [Corynebacterium halotolerans YIM 70093 = DSM 44683]|uniref:RNA polymerase sigma factor sigW n=1 Tax=Corynebacterium halotolerans YIM 70093 = DSM 44683 TaxID=1121362 RepID=M1NRZ8_9CORY|nr:RNA polymerase sigma factor sigW [Corynebacterium halotolerans YIM 70093 = DSM 44683]
MTPEMTGQAWLRLRQTTGITDPAAWLTTVTSRLTLDAATTAERRRVDYVGPWLPDVVVLPGTERTDSTGDAVVGAGLVDLALVRLLHTLAPVDRAIVVLHDVAGVPHDEIARITDTTPAAARKRHSRARRALREAPATAHDAGLAGRLATALRAGDLSALIAALSEDVVLWTDSGGATRAARRPVSGADKVARFLAGIIDRFGMPALSVETGYGAVVIRAVSPDMVRLVVLESSGGRVTGIQIQQNPAKQHEIRDHRN